ncbi:unnamed protein product, partial [Rotaria magnacalcarata]
MKGKLAIDYCIVPLGDEGQLS